jgi:hypothetical protein
MEDQINLKKSRKIEWKDLNLITIVANSRDDAFVIEELQLLSAICGLAIY